MSGSLNNVQLIGRLGADPELRYTATGTPVANFRIATSEAWTDKQGTKQERTEWHSIVAWAKLGEICGEHLRKGRQVYVEGRLQTRQWEDREGNQRYKTEIQANKVLFIGDRQGGQPAQPQARAPAQAPSRAPTQAYEQGPGQGPGPYGPAPVDPLMDDLPF